MNFIRLTPAILVSVVCASAVALAQEACSTCTLPQSSVMGLGEIKIMVKAICGVEYQQGQCSDYFASRFSHIHDPQERQEFLEKFAFCPVDPFSRGEGLGYQLGASAVSCGRGFKDGAVDTLMGLPNYLFSLYEDSQECKRDTKRKRERLEQFNDFLDPQERLALDESQLKSLSCNKFVQRLLKHRREIFNRRFEEFVRTGRWSLVSRTLPKIPKYKTSDGPSILTMAKELLKRLGIQEDCFNAQARSEMYCEAIGVVTAVIVMNEAVAGVPKLTKLTHLSGKSPAAIATVAQGLATPVASSAAVSKTALVSKTTAAVASSASKAKGALGSLRNAALLMWDDVMSFASAGAGARASSGAGAAAVEGESGAVIGSSVGAVTGAGAGAGNMLIDQTAFEAKAAAHVQSGKIEDAARVLSASPVVRNIPRETDRKRYIQQFIEKARENNPGAKR